MALVNIDETESVAWVTLERPPANILDAEFLRAIDHALAQVAELEGASRLALAVASYFLGG